MKFIVIPMVSLDNNLAERDLRMIKVIQKNLVVLGNQSMHKYLLE